MAAQFAARHAQAALPTPPSAAPIDAPHEPIRASDSCLRMAPLPGLRMQRPRRTLRSRSLSHRRRKRVHEPSAQGAVATGARGRLEPTRPVGHVARAPLVPVETRGVGQRRSELRCPGRSLASRAAPRLHSAARAPILSEPAARPRRTVGAGESTHRRNPVHPNDRAGPRSGHGPSPSHEIWPSPCRAIRASSPRLDKPADARLPRSNGARQTGTWPADAREAPAAPSLPCRLVLSGSGLRPRLVAPPPGTATEGAAACSRTGRVGEADHSPRPPLDLASRPILSSSAGSGPMRPRRRRPAIFPDAPLRPRLPFGPGDPARDGRGDLATETRSGEHPRPLRRSGLGPIPGRPARKPQRALFGATADRPGDRPCPRDARPGSPPSAGASAERSAGPGGPDPARQRSAGHRSAGRRRSATSAGPHTRSRDVRSAGPGAAMVARAAIGSAGCRLDGTRRIPIRSPTRPACPLGAGRIPEPLPRSAGSPSVGGRRNGPRRHEIESLLRLVRSAREDGPPLGSAPEAPSAPVPVTVRGPARATTIRRDGAFDLEAGSPPRRATRPRTPEPGLRGSPPSGRRPPDLQRPTGNCPRDPASSAPRVAEASRPAPSRLAPSPTGSEAGAGSRARPVRRSTGRPSGHGAPRTRAP